MAATWKTVRVFISSTFRDMQAERDHLVRFVFPQLRKELLPRRIHLIDVDLRWGVTSQQDALAVCREIIDDCRPRFLCVLGGRYGWVPPGTTRSITADEVHYGVLDRELRERGASYFYFRADADTAKMVEVTVGEFREPEGSESQKRLRELKQAIFDAKLNPFTYPAQWDHENRRVTGLKQFGDRVYDDLLGGLRSDPELRERFLADAAAEPDEFVEENASLEAFVEERHERFVLGSRKELLDQLLAAATGGNGYVCLIGAPGSGKSALLAHLSRQNVFAEQASPLLIRHFVGAGPGSTDLRRTLRRLCHELQMGCREITAAIPDQLDKLKEAFADFLQQACARRRVVILLDAVNQFSPVARSAGLRWLPETLPPNARVILSAPDGPVLEELRRRPCPPQEIAMKPLTVDDGEVIIEQFSARYRKNFEAEQRAVLLAKADAGTPLYLLAALEELRTLGTFEEISRRIAELPSTTAELFLWILKRLENDDGFRDATGRLVGPELVPRFAALLGASRQGLSHRELDDLLDQGDPRGNIAALLYLLRPYLMRRGELLDFYHGQFREAATNAWLQTDAQRRSAHLTLADHFERQPDILRKAFELPWQLEHAAHWERLRTVLSNLDFLGVLWETDRQETLGYWQSVRKGLRIVSGNILRSDVQHHTQNGGSLLALAELLASLGDRETAARAFDVAVRRLREAGLAFQLVKALEGRADICIARREFSAARAICREIVALCRANGDERGLSRALGNLAITWYEEDPDRALGLLQEQEAMARRLSDYDSLQRSLGDQSIIQAGHHRGFRVATQSARTALAVCTEHCLLSSAPQQRFNYAVLAYRGGLQDWATTEAELESIRQNAEALGLRPLLAACLGQQAQFLAERGHVNAALRKHGRAEILWREIEDASGLIKCLSHEARLLGRRFRVHRARRKAEEALALMAKHDYAPAARASLSRFISQLLLVQQVTVVSLGLGVLLVIAIVEAVRGGKAPFVWPLILVFGMVWLAVVGLLNAARHLGRRCRSCNGQCFSAPGLLVCLRCGHVDGPAAHGSRAGLH